AMGTIGALLGSVSVSLHDPTRGHGGRGILRRAECGAECGARRGGARRGARLRILLWWTSTTTPPPPRPTTAGSRCGSTWPAVTSIWSPARRCSAGAAWTRHRGAAGPARRDHRTAARREDRGSRLRLGA